MIYITGDTHGDFSRFEAFTKQHSVTKEDIMIILGDVGLNIWGDEHDRGRKEYAKQFDMTFFCIHGNHEKRPFDIPTYQTKEFCGGTVWYEEEYPNYLFAKDGEIYHLGGYDCIVIGGAYSVDKNMRLLYGYPWYANEQPSPEIKQYVESQLAKREQKIDIVLSHTCPLDYRPIETFRPSIDQSTVDTSTEKWLNQIEHHLTYQKWYCGHYHISKKEYNLQFMFEDIEEFGI